MSANKWVAVEFGKSTIKASVLNENNKPIRLSYPMCGYETTFFSSVVYCNDDNVSVGDYASLLGTIDPGSIEVNWMSSEKDKDIKKKIAKSIFETIKHAAIRHYKDANIGIVLLYNNELDKDLYNTAQAMFYDVKTMTCCNVLQKILFPNLNHPVLIVDFGDSALKISLMDKNNAFYKNDKLGFCTIDMFSLIDFEDVSSLTNRETRILSELIQCIKVRANNGENTILPKFAKCNDITNKIQQKMTTYFYQCFDECSNALKSWSKSWNDINDVIFIGGGAHSTIINSTFHKYIENYRPMDSYNSKNTDFDAQYAATHCAVQMPDLRCVKEFERLVNQNNIN